MTRRKVYKDMIDQLDLTREIVKLIDQDMPEIGYPHVVFNLTDIEYEDEEHLLHYANDIIRQVLDALNFVKEETSDHIYSKEGKVIAFTSVYAKNEFVIQRQA